MAKEPLTEQVAHDLIAAWVEDSLALAVLEVGHPEWVRAGLASGRLRKKTLRDLIEELQEAGVWPLPRAIDRPQT